MAQLEKTWDELVAQQQRVGHQRAQFAAGSYSLTCSQLKDEIEGHRAEAESLQTRGGALEARRVQLEAEGRALQEENKALLVRQKQRNERMRELEHK